MVPDSGSSTIAGLDQRRDADEEIDEEDNGKILFSEIPKQF
jgi:hypothetical protein